MDAAEYYKAFRTREAFAIYEEMLQGAKHWDTVDKIASNLIGMLVLEHRELEQKLREWRGSDNMWLRRASLLAHLKHKGNTNVDLLQETVLMLAHEDEFFIQKAIGWVLREYSKTDPHYVAEFVARHHDQLSPLSRREAMKVIEKAHPAQVRKQRKDKRPSVMMTFFPFVVPTGFRSAGGSRIQPHNPGGGLLQSRPSVSWTISSPRLIGMTD